MYACTVGAGSSELFTVFHSKNNAPRLTLFSAAMFALFSSSASFANSVDANNPDGYSAIAGQPVVVTAARIEQSLDDVLGDVTVVTSEEIRRTGAQNLLDVLRSVPGVQLTYNGGPQQTAGVFIRGAESRHTLLLIDGMRVGSTDGITNTQIQMVPLDQIERVEILRGAGSALYGADAIGGVVQVITKKGKKGTSGEYQVGLGSNNRKQANVGISVGGESTSIRLGAGYQNEDGFSSLSAPRLPGQTDHDGYRKSSGSLNIQHQFNAQHQVGFNALVADLNNEYDSSFPPDEHYFNRNVQSVYGLNSSHKWNTMWTTRLGLSTSTDEIDLPNFSTENKSHQTQFQVMNELALAGGKVLLGAEQLTQSFQQFIGVSQTAFAFGKRNTDSALVGYLGQAGQLSYQANLRYDDDSQYDSATTGQLSGEYKVSPLWSIGASAGTGFKAPGVQQIVGFGGVRSLNLNLQPEESENYEVYAKLQTPTYTNRFTVFNNEITNLIDFNNSTFGYFNQSEVDIVGVSADTQANWKYGKWGGDVQFLSAKDATGQQALRRAKRTARVFADSNWGKFTARAELLAASERRDVGNRVMGGYGITNIAAIYKTSEQSEVSLRVENIFEKKYEFAAGYNVPQRDVLVSYRQSF